MTFKNFRASLLCYFKLCIAIGEFKLELQSRNAQSGSNSMNFRALWPWNLMNDLQLGKSEGFESYDQPIVWKRPIWVKIGDVLYRVTLKFNGWPWKTIGQLSFAVSSFMQHFIAISEFKLELQSRNAQLGQIQRFLELCDLEIWSMTLKNNRAPLLCYFKLYASFCSHPWIQAGVTVQKHLIWVKIDDFLAVWPCNLTYDLEKQ